MPKTTFQEVTWHWGPLRCLKSRNTYYGSDLGNCSILQRKGPKRGGFLGLRRAFWGLKTPFLGDRNAKG